MLEYILWMSENIASQPQWDAEIRKKLALFHVPKAKKLPVKQLKQLSYSAFEAETGIQTEFLP